MFGCQLVNCPVATFGGIFHCIGHWKRRWGERWTDEYVCENHVLRLLGGLVKGVNTEYETIQDARAVVGCQIVN